MAFEFGIDILPPSDFEISEQQKEIACECWFNKAGIQVEIKLIYYIEKSLWVMLC